MIDVPPTTHSNHIREALLTELFPPLWVPPQVSPELDEMDNLVEYKQWAELKCKELSQALKLGATDLEPTSQVRHENALFCPISEQCKMATNLPNVENEGGGGVKEVLNNVQ